MLGNYYFLQFCCLMFPEALRSWCPVIYTLSNHINAVSARKIPSELLSLQEDVDSIDSSICHFVSPAATQFQRFSLKRIAMRRVLELNCTAGSLMA